MRLIHIMRRRAAWTVLRKKRNLFHPALKHIVRHAMKGADAANMFEKEGVLDYLIDGYDVLHTQSLEYVIDEIELYLKKRGAVR